MTNKAISVYAEALKRQKEEEGKQPSLRSPTREQKDGEEKEGKVERNKSVLQERQKDRKTDFALPSISRTLEMKAAVHTTFRYPQDLLDKLDEAQYQVWRRYKKKITKNAILVAALAYFLGHFEAKGKESELHKELIEEHT